MLKRNLLTLAVAAGLCTSAFAQIDYSSPSFSILASNADLETLSGQSAGSATFWSMSLTMNDDTGNLMVVSDPSGGTGFGLLEVDLSNPTGGTSAVWATDAQLNAVSDDEDAGDDNDVTGMDYDPDRDLVWVSDRENDDEIYSVSSAGTVTGLAGVSTGIFASSIAYENDALFYIDVNTDEVLTYDIVGASESTLQGTGVAGFSEGPYLVGSELYWWNEAFFGGDDSLQSVNTSTGNITVQATNAMFGDAGPSSLALTSTGVLFAWDANPESPNVEDFLVWDGTTQHRFTQASIQTDLGLSAVPITSDAGSATLVSESASQVVFAFGDSASGNIIGVTFVAGASVDQWSAYE